MCVLEFDSRYIVIGDRCVRGRCTRLCACQPTPWCAAIQDYNLLEECPYPAFIYDDEIGNQYPRSLMQKRSIFPFAINLNINILFYKFLYSHCMEKQFLKFFIHTVSVSLSQ